MAFLEAVSPYGFFYHTFALNKDPGKLYGRGFQFKESLYKYVCSLVFENAKPYLQAAKVVIDGSGDRAFRGQLARYLRQRVKTEDGQRLIRSVKIERSSTNNLVQLADYVVGVTNRKIMGKPRADEYHRCLATHQLTSQIWPK